MLFLQGTRDAFARRDLLEPLVRGLGPRATLHLVEGADHSFGVVKRSGRSPAEVLAELLATTVDWARATMLATEGTAAAAAAPGVGASGGKRRL
jgi:predicted alpha/beta-hydrolase family hydrolase